MMIQEEFSRLIHMFQQATDGKNISMQDLVRKSFEFIEHLKEEIKNGGEEERMAAIKMMNELYRHMKNHTKTICEKTGVTEEQLIANSENPANFSPEQWRQMQDTKEKLAMSSQQLTQLLQKQEPGKPTPGPAEKKERKKRKPPKSHWLRS